MKNIALLGCCLTLSACFGNWSNDDLEFQNALNALPGKKDLQPKLPGATAGALKGEGTRRDPLIDPVVGARSELYQLTKGATANFNSGLGDLLGILDFIRTISPTSRTEDSRIWGPFDDPNNAGFQVRVVILKIDDAKFGYAFQHRPKGGEFFNTVEGFFKPTKTLRKGTGQLVINAADAVAKGLKFDSGFDKVVKVELGYVTDMFPVTVLMKFTLKPGEPTTALDYGYQENEDKSGAMGFRSFNTDPNISQLDTGSAWLASGAGYGVLTVVEGNYKGATQIDCWDAAFNIVYAKQTWPGGKTVGDPASCVTVANGMPKP